MNVCTTDTSHRDMWLVRSTTRYVFQIRDVHSSETQWQCSQWHSNSKIANFFWRASTTSDLGDALQEAGDGQWQWQGDGEELEAEREDVRNSFAVPVVAHVILAARPAQLKCNRSQDIAVWTI